jgi:hypothetical protein
MIRHMLREICARRGDVIKSLGRSRDAQYASPTLAYIAYNVVCAGPYF